MLAVSCGAPPEARKQAFLESGNRYFEKAKYREAIVEYRNAVQIDERFGEARARLAATYERVGDFPAALGEYVRAADLLPDNLDLQVAAGNYLLAARRFDEAQNRAETVLKRDAKNVRAQVLLGNALGGLRQFDEAIAEIEQAIDSSPIALARTLSLVHSSRVEGRGLRPRQRSRKRSRWRLIGFPASWRSPIITGPLVSSTWRKRRCGKHSTSNHGVPARTAPCRCFYSPAAGSRTLRTT